MQKYKSFCNFVRLKEVFLMVIKPKKLDIFVMKQFLLLFVGTFFICLFVLMMQFVWRSIDEMIGKGLTIDILGQFFWYMGLMLTPQAFPLAILLSSLITFGNLGESSELTAIKASGVSLLQVFRGMIIFVVSIALMSFYFQNVITPNANRAFGRLLISMKQTSPELEIPEGVFYGGIPNCNVYVQKKDMDRRMLYGVMIYRLTSSFEDAAIILADSGSLAMTEEKKHLVLHLYSGEWFENMRSSDVVAGASNVPYRRETFAQKDIVIDFDAGFNLADEDVFSHDPRTKSLKKILVDIDSMNSSYDTLGMTYYSQERAGLLYIPASTTQNVGVAKNTIAVTEIDIDSAFSKLSEEKKREVVSAALDKVNMANTNMEFKTYVTNDNEYYLRKHKLEAIAKFTLAFSCIIFFFIGAPLGAIIRKGGLGMPLIVSVLVFIVYFILENMGTRMVREGAWPIWFGAFLSTAVLAPLSVFFTIKANKDSAILNADFYTSLFRRIFGIVPKRYIASKEVILHAPDYAADAEQLMQINEDLAEYARAHKLFTAPSVVKIFFRSHPDTVIESINERQETIISDLENTRDKYVLSAINHYPVILTDAHTAPFKSHRLNVMAGVIFPMGIFLYFRIWRFRLILLRNIRQIRHVNQEVVARINEILDDENKKS